MPPTRYLSTQRIPFGLNEIELYEKTTAAQPSLIPNSTTSATMSTVADGAARPLSSCFDRNRLTSCTGSGNYTDPRLTVNFYCTSSGTALGTLSEVSVYASKMTNGSDLELVLRNVAGSVERIVSFPAGSQQYRFALDANATNGARLSGRAGRRGVGSSRTLDQSNDL